MNIINQLEKTVTPAILGDSDSSSNVAYVSLLEQFYAILVARLALPQVYSQLIRVDEVITPNRATESPLFERLWEDQAIQQFIIQELAATHHIDEITTSQLLINAAPLAYRELTILANGQFLPAFLQSEQAALRQYLPIWSAPIIIADQDLSNELLSNPDSIIIADINTIPVSDTSLVGAQPPVATSIIAASTPSYVENTELHSVANTDAIHANPSAHHWAENKTMKHEKVRTRNQRNDLLVWVFLLIVAIAAMALAAWALFIRPNNVPPVEPAVTEPVIVTPAPEPPAQVMTPVELIVGVDNSGSLYTCSATVGDEALQSALQQALNTSFGEQASICELTVRTGVATSIASMPMEALPNILTLLRPIPFARLHLQNDRLMLEAPDNLSLQRMVTDIRTLAPTMIIDSVAPLPLPNNNNGNAANNMPDMNGMNNQFENDGLGSNTQNNYNGSGAGEYQAPDDNTGDSVQPTLTPIPNNNGFNNNLNNAPTNTPSNIPSNTPTNNRSTSGSISQSEADAMANSVIVAEPAQVR